MHQSMLLACLSLPALLAAAPGMATPSNSNEPAAPSALLVQQSHDLPQSPPPSARSRDTVSDSDLARAFAALEAVDTYRDIVEAVNEHEAIIASTRMVALADDRLASGRLDENQRVLVTLLRQLSLDCRQLGARPAARLLGVRLVAIYALAADTPGQFAAVLEQFTPLEDEITPQVARQALSAPPDSWPEGLLPLMEQLARDWPARGALAAATAMAAGAGGSSTNRDTAPDRPVEPRAGQPLVGHWRSTRIIFEQPQDENMVLHGDGPRPGRSSPAADPSRNQVAGRLRAARWTCRGATAPSGHSRSRSSKDSSCSPTSRTGASSGSVSGSHRRQHPGTSAPWHHGP
jgi:hypothetical protein